MIRIRKIASLLIVALAAAIVTSVTLTQETALIRFIHLDAGSPTVDIKLNGEFAAADLRYGEATTRVEVAAGPADLSTYMAGTTVKVASERITLEGGPAAVILAGAESRRSHIVSEDLKPVSFGNTRLAFFNALDTKAQVSVASQDEAPALNISLAAGNASRSLDSIATTRDIVIKTADEMEFGPVSQLLSAGVSNLLILHGSSSAPDLFNAVTAAEGGEDSGRLRFIHAIEGAAPVDLRVNGELIAPALGFAAPSPPIALAAGSQNIAVNLGSAEIMSERMQLRPGEMSTVVLMRTSAGLGMFAFADVTDDVDADSAVVSLINAIPDSVINYLQLESGAIIALNVQSNEAGASAKIVPGRQAMTLHLNIGGNQGEVSVPPHYFHGGSYYRLIALAGGVFSAPRLLITETSLERQIRSRPASADIEPEESSAPDITEPPEERDADQPVAEPVTQPEVSEPDTQAVAEEAVEEPATEDVVEAAEQEASQSDAPTPPEPSLTPYATVNVNPDAALHIRQYPSSDALSLGLLPAHSTLMILGRRGPSQFGPGELTDLPLDLSGYQKDAAAELAPYQDLPAAETWLYVVYTTPDGGAIVGWTNANYLEVFSRTGGHQRLAYLRLVPQNRAGGTHSTDIRPPELADYVAARVIGLNPDALLNLRRSNDVNSDVLALLPTDTMMRMLGLDDTGAWGFVEYQPSAGNPIRGWVYMPYIQLLLNGAPVRPDALRALDPAAVPIVSGTVTGGVLPSTPTEPGKPVEGIVGEVSVNIDSALHLRRYPDATSESLALIPPDTILPLDGVTESGGWYKAQYEGEEGWVAAPYLVLSMNGRKYARGLLESQLPRFNDLGF